MNEDKLEKVSNKLDLDQTIIKKARWKAFWKKFVYPIVQLATYFASIGLLILTFPLFSIGMGGGDFIRSTYPADLLEDSFFVLINPFNYVLHAGNFTGSFLLRKKTGIRKGYIVAISILNLLLAGLAFVALRQLVNNPMSSNLDGTGIAIDYGVYQNKSDYKEHRTSILEGIIL